MFINHLAVALRNLRRNALLTFIHLAGLSIGLAAAILILLYIKEEFRYVHHHSLGHRVFRVLQDDPNEGFRPFRSGALPPAMQRAFPEVEAAARLLDDWWILVRHGEHEREIDVALGDPSLLEMFDIALVEGDRATVLDRPNTIVITRSVARAFFGAEDPVGKALTMADDSFAGEFIVTGIMENRARHAAVVFDGLTAFPSAESPGGLKERFEGWREGPFANYVMLREGADAAEVERRLPALLAMHLDAEIASQLELRLQPINRLRLYSEADYGMEGHHPWGVGERHPRQPRGIDRINRIALVGTVLLLIACFNFMNLATAQSVRRAREVAMRKILGARRRQLIRQFLIESILLAGAAIVVGYGLAGLSLPHFNAMLLSRLSLDLDAGLGFSLVGLTLAVGLVAGSYPAFYLSLARPSVTLRTGVSSRGGAAGLRKGLVVLQFAVSGILVFAALVVYLQTRHAGERDLAYEPADLVNLPVGRFPVDTSFEVMRQGFASHTAILAATASRPALGNFSNGGGLRRIARPDGRPDAEVTVQVYQIDEHFLETNRLRLAAGRNLRARDSDRESILLSETAARRLGWDDAIGKRLEIENGLMGTVVGVVKDFHTQSLHHAVAPVVMFHGDRHTVTVRINEAHVDRALAHLEATWRHFLPDIRPEYGYVSRHLAFWYRGDVQLSDSCTLFSLLAIFVACLGLFGLATFSAEQRTKEIGIRKVLGATLASLAGTFSREFVSLVVVANLVAAPVAFYVMRMWLDNFAYRIALTPMLFLVCAATTLTIAILTVGVQSVKVGTSDPVGALRSE